MPSTIEFPFSADEALLTIPIALSHADFSISANALLDTGSTVNLLTYSIGVQLGSIWEEQTRVMLISGVWREKKEGRILLDETR